MWKRTRDGKIALTALTAFLVASTAFLLLMLNVRLECMSAIECVESAFTNMRTILLATTIFILILTLALIILLLACPDPAQAFLNPSYSNTILGDRDENKDIRSEMYNV